jgi:hypothetical protein
MSDSKFQDKVFRTEGVTREICENGSKHHTVRQFSIITSVFYRNRTGI